MNLIKSLVDLYDRMEKNGEVPLDGYVRGKIHYVVVLKDDGGFYFQTVDIKDSLIPRDGVGRTSGLRPYFVLDNAKYVLGFEDTETKYFAEFKRTNLVADIEDYGFGLFKSFLAAWDPARIAEFPELAEITPTSWVAFQVEGSKEFLHESEAVKAWWDGRVNKKEWWEDAVGEDGPVGRCLITGELGLLSENHPNVMGIVGVGKGSPIISSNCDAFNHYGYKKAANSGISKIVADKYTKALNEISGSRNNQKELVGDTTYMFWTDKKTEEENLFLSLVNSGFDTKEDSQDNIVREKLRTILGMLRRGEKPQDLDIDKGAQYHLLGLIGKQGRVSIRDHITGSLRGLTDSVAKHYADIRMESEDDVPEYPGLRFLVDGIYTAKGDNDSKKGVLRRDLMISIFRGTDYPQAVFYTTIDELKRKGIDGRKNYKRTYAQLCVLAGVLRRNFKMEVPVSLDVECKDKGYLLGRLFAVYEKNEEDGNGSSKTISEKLLSSALDKTLPTFTRLAKMNTVYLAKLHPGQKVMREKLIGEIFESVQSIPMRLSTKEQGSFLVGYHQQRASFFKTKDTE